MRNWRALRAPHGFTLVQTVVVLAIVGFLVSGAFAVTTLSRNARFNADVDKTLAELRRMQQNARVVENNKKFGMQFAANSWTTFQVDPATGTRTDLTTQNLTAATQAWSLSNAGNQIVFERLTGRTEGDVSATLTYTLSGSTKSKVIKIDVPGVLYVQ